VREPFFYWKIINWFRSDEHWALSSPGGLMIMAVLVGLVTGCAGVAFRLLISFFTGVFFGGGEQYLGFLGRFHVILLPAIGGAIVGPLIYFYAREARGHGVPEVMAAVVEKGGVIKPRLMWVKMLAASITIGSGGSAGRVGPIVTIGSSIGSALGQVFHLSASNLRTLVACGAAGGLSATFNAPIGGVLFAQEIILGRYSTGNFVLIVLSSVAAAVVSRVYYGNVPALYGPPYELLGPHELGFYVVLGILAGLWGVLFTKVLYWFTGFFERTRIPEYLLPAVGGLMVGFIGLAFPQIFGVGYDVVEMALMGDILPLTLAALLVFKLLATSLTLGSGGSGGVFAPGLFMGAMLGGLYGYLIHWQWPALSAPSGAYSLVGMAAVFASMAHAPATAVVMLFEMTGDYRIILPLMTACVIGTMVSTRLLPDSIYTLKLSRRGLDIKNEQIPDYLENFVVKDIMTSKLETVDRDEGIVAVARKMRKSGHLGYPVINPDGTLLGVITWGDIAQALRERRTPATVETISSKEIIFTWPEESLKDAAHKLGENRIGRLPVLESEHGGRLVGIITRSDIINQYRTDTRHDQP
jgi:CIC family chloride channel protein